jgi:DNA-binding transcriptional LysR family regulator
MDHNDVVLFARVVEGGSFTAAARTQGLPKSSVSRQVARLERDLGVRLLQRTTRHLGLTDAGQAFFDRVRGAIAGLEEAADAVRELGSEPRGVVRVTAPADAGSLGIAEAVVRFVRRHPAIHVELVLTSRVVDLVAEGFDLAVRAGRLADSTLIARRIGSSDLGLFAAPSYLRRCGPPKDLADLAHHDCVLFRAHGGRASWRLTGSHGEQTVEVAGAVSADDLDFCARAVVAGAGVGLLPRVLGRPRVGADRLVPVLPEWRLAGGALQIVLPSSRFVPARVALLRDFLVEHLKDEMRRAERLCSRAGRRRPPAKRRASGRSGEA